MKKDMLIHKIIQLDVIHYRHYGLKAEGYYTHEKEKFFTTLMAIYDKLSEEDLKEILRLRTH